MLTLTDKLYNLCKNGKLKQALILNNKMKKNNYTLCSLLKCCINCNKSYLYKNIWNIFILKYKILPNHKSYIIACLAASKCNDINGFNKIYLSFPYLLKLKMNINEYNQFITSLGNIGYINLMLYEYKNMKKLKHIKINDYTYSNLINLSIKNYNFNLFLFIINEIRNNKNKNFIINIYVFTNIINGFVKFGKINYIPLIWNEFIIKYNININNNISLYTITIVSISVSISISVKNKIFINKLLNEIKSNKYLFKSMKIINWHQIITTFGKIKDYDKMWNEYNNMIKYGKEENNKIKPNIETFIILSSFEKRKKYQLKILNQLKKYIKNEWNKLNIIQLKKFYRIAIECNHIEIKENIWNILNNHNNYHINVLSTFIYNNKQYIMNNLFYNESKQILKITDNLIKNINHKINISLFPEFSNKNIAYKAICYHSEKKSLAFLINKNIDNIKINVNLKMCKDCHIFFCKVSKYYKNKKIICIDPNITHLFKNGKCYSCQ